MTMDLVLGDAMWTVTYTTGGKNKDLISLFVVVLAKDTEVTVTDTVIDCQA